ncbi:MAG TPA: hypothetical protein PKD55_03340 [Bellilinea sp.]|nr:hypothetical protein [Bellilinea sp.]
MNEYTPSTQTDSRDRDKQIRVTAIPENSSFTTLAYGRLAREIRFDPAALATCKANSMPAIDRLENRQALSKRRGHYDFTIL